MSNELQQAADKLGAKHGHNAGTWAIDGNTSDETKRAIIRGYEDRDPLILDMQPSPLSGEWADDPTIASILDEIGLEGPDPDEMVSSDLLDRYEMAYSDAFWSEVIRSAQATL